MIARLLLLKDRTIFRLARKYKWFLNLYRFITTSSNSVYKSVNQEELEKRNREFRERLEQELNLMRNNNAKSYKFKGKVYKTPEYIYQRNLNKQRLIDVMKKDKVSLLTAIKKIEAKVNE